MPDAQIKLQQKESMLISLQTNLLRAQNRMKKYADLKRTE
jgi:hypothetical protein